nr:Fic family protein [Flavihumibacter sp. CACIAM 22H1]
MTEEKLFAWHRMLLGQNKKVAVGQWRSQEEPMQVVSGVLGKENLHYEAPPSSKVPEEMKQFIEWFNDTAPGGKLEIKKLRCVLLSRICILKLYILLQMAMESMANPN